MNIFKSQNSKNYDTSIENVVVIILKFEKTFMHFKNVEKFINDFEHFENSNSKRNTNFTKEKFNVNFFYNFTIRKY